MSTHAYNNYCAFDKGHQIQYCLDVDFNKPEDQEYAIELAEWILNMLNEE